MAAGIHHVTLITRNVQANVDYYAGFLGLRLVKQTAGFEDAMQLHLFYGDGAATPGTLVTFLVWEDGSPGRIGHGQTSEISFAIDPSSIGFWLTRALSFGFRPEGPMNEFGEPTLRLKDPDGIIVKLVGVSGLETGNPWDAGNILVEHAIKRIRGATILTESPEMTLTFLRDNFEYQPAETEGNIQRMKSQSGDIIDIRDAQGFWSSAPGTGTIDHIAFRAKDVEDVERLEEKLRSRNAGQTNTHDRKYFHSLYVREPGGVLFEFATDGPGMTVDEPSASLGARLFIPEFAPVQGEDARVLLPQFAMPGEERVIYRDLPFVHRFYTPETPDGTVFFLLHGSGGNETSLLPLAHRAAPRATLLGIRGRATDEGTPRWFRRFTPQKFDQKDIRSEAEAFAAFIAGAIQSYRIDPERIAFIGHSNGANFLAAFMLLHPHIVKRAALLRPSPVLGDQPAVDLSDTDILLIAGKTDPFSISSAQVAEMLAERNARLDTQWAAAAHDTGDDDIRLLANWLGDEART
ncbi:MAG: VOC family protein [Phyllobacterium sp.]